MVLSLFILAIHPEAAAASKPHTIAFGKWTAVHCSASSGCAGDKPLTLKVRPLLVDARVKEFTLGPPHDVTDRLFVIRGAFRMNDSLPDEPASSPHWQWERGGWLLVDRLTGRITPVALPAFDALYSSASWYRDYVAYCGASDDGTKFYAVVVQIARRKPVLQKLVGSATEGKAENPAEDSRCPAPTWQRNPTRVTFEATGIPKQTFAIRGHTVNVVTAEEEDEEASK
jgi:hypothetical protein